MYPILYYNDLDYKGLEQKFNKMIKFLEEGDFKSAEVKKLKPTCYFRAKLDSSNRLLFKPVRYNNRRYLLILEVIRNHEYDKSRFLQGGKIVEEDIVPSTQENTAENILDKELEKIEGLKTYRQDAFVRLLNKFIIFDKAQEDVLSYNLPLIIIGSAGSGKTSVALEKLKTLEGKVLYVSLSSYLVHNTQKLYFSFNYNNDNQDIDFLSFKEFLETIEIPSAKPMNDAIFLNWFNRQNISKDLFDGRKIYEEFSGVITGSNASVAYLSKEEYLNLGIKQSIFLNEQKLEVYRLFEKYLEFLSSEEYYDSNIISYNYTSLPYASSIYDAILVDEVQDFTNSRLSLILNSLKDKTKFLLCGDANQIVHPNFFSWSSLKSFFYKDEGFSASSITRILTTNYRSSKSVTELANRILRLKNYRFGSIDKESHYLIDSTSNNYGSVCCLEATSSTITEINAKTSKSTSYAIIVLLESQKREAQKLFNSPLIFTIQEAKGLEYENIILYNFISAERAYKEISKDVDLSFTDASFTYARTKDKSDKSLESYKFYINAFYVAITRAIASVYVIEKEPSCKFLRLLDINQIKEINIKDATSSKEEWQKEASKLSSQGKEEQAKAIEDIILRHKTPTWQILDHDSFIKLQTAVLTQKSANKKDVIKLLNYAIIYSNKEVIRELQAQGVKAAGNIAKCTALMLDEYFSEYTYNNINNLLKKIEQYGLEYRNEFNLTPLIASAYAGKKTHIEKLVELGAQLTAVDNNNRNAFMISLARASSDLKYAKGSFGDIYALLKPDAIMLAINNKLVKIENNKGEYFLLNFLLTRVGIIKEGTEKVGVFKATNLAKALAHFPDNVLLSYRKRREYISALLSRNEINGNSSYNKHLFKRIALGLYTLNPQMKIKVE